MVLPIVVFFSLLLTSPSLKASQVVAWGRNDYGQLNLPANLTNAVAISAGFDHCLALQGDGSVVAWGSGTNGQNSIPVSLSNNVVAISAGSSHNLVMLNDGSLMAWGAGLTNSGTLPDFGQSIIPSNVTNVVAFSAGGYFNVALLSDGTVTAWGRNQYGQTNVPAGLTNVVMIKAGGSHCLALKNDGTVVAWGGGLYGQANVPAGLSNIVAIAATADNSYAIKSDGTLVAWGDNGAHQNEIPSGVTNVVLASGGAYHSEALMDNGTVRVWGSYDSAFPSDPTNHYVVVAGGFYMGLALTNDGTPVITAQPASRRIFQGIGTAFRALVAAEPPISYQWSFNGEPISDATNALLSLPAVQTNQSGLYSFVASNSLGMVASSNALLTVIQQPPVLTSQPANVITYRFGPASFNSAAMGSPPLFFQWQLNGTNLPGATNTSLTFAAVPPAFIGNVSVVVSNEFGVVASTNAFLTILAVVDGGDSTYRFNQSVSVPVSLTNAVAVAAGTFHSMALKSDNTLVVWGNNQYKQTNVPVAATNIMAIAARGYTCGIVRSNGTVFMWGDSYEFNGNSGKTNPPASATNVIAMALGDYHCLALRKNGTVVGWGRSNEGQTNPPPSCTNIVAIAAGSYHSLALRSNGTMVAWGQNTSGQTNIPANLTNIIAIAAANNYNFALKSDGSIVAWGGTSTPFVPGKVVRIDTGSSPGATYFCTVLANGSVFGGYAGVVSNAIAIAAGSYHNLVLIGDGSPYVYWPPSAIPSAHPGDNLSTSISVSGSGPVFYQWQLNGVDIIGATNATLTLTNIPITSAGNYRCIVYNGLGTNTSLATTLNMTRYTLTFNVTNGATQMTTNGFKLRVAGLAGQGSLVVYASTNLLDWVPVCTNPPAVGTFDFLDAKTTNQPLNFYQAVEGP